MEIYSQVEAPTGLGRETVFRYSAFTGFLATFVTFMLFLACLGLALEGGIAGSSWEFPAGILYILAFILWMVSLLCLMTYRARMRSGNWLVKSCPDRLFVKFRSYLNDHYPDTDPTVLEIEYSEIEWIRRTRERLTTPSCNEEDANQIQFFTFLDLKLKNGDLSRLQEVLQQERNRKPPRSKTDELRHELFLARKRKAPDSEINRLKENIKREKAREPKKTLRSRIKHHHYPVRVVQPDIVRIQWNGIHPRIGPAMDFLSQYLPVKPELSLATDTTSSTENNRPDDVILDLAMRGKIFQAITLVRKTYGYSLTQSKQFVDDLLKS